jgi:hypothetical protein
VVLAGTGAKRSRSPDPSGHDAAADRIHPWMLDITAWQGHADDDVDALVWPTLPAETVEFPVSYASEKSMPLVQREPEDRPPGVPAVTNADLATGKARHLDAVAVGVTQRALSPVKT